MSTVTVSRPRSRIPYARVTVPLSLLLLLVPLLFYNWGNYALTFRHSTSHDAARGLIIEYGIIPIEGDEYTFKERLWAQNYTVMGTYGYGEALAAVVRGSSNLARGFSQPNDLELLYDDDAGVHTYMELRLGDLIRRVDNPHQLVVPARLPKAGQQLIVKDGQVVMAYPWHLSNDRDRTKTLLPEGYRVVATGLQIESKAEPDKVWVVQIRIDNDVMWIGADQLDKFDF